MLLLHVSLCFIVNYREFGLAWRQNFHQNFNPGNGSAELKFNAIMCLPHWKIPSGQIPPPPICESHIFFWVVFSLYIVCINYREFVPVWRQNFHQNFNPGKCTGELKFNTITGLLYWKIPICQISPTNLWVPCYWHFFRVVFSLCIVCIFNLSSVLYLWAWIDVNGTVLLMYS